MEQKSGFEREVLVRLEYIKENQEKHDEIFGDVYKKINSNSKHTNILKGAFAIFGGIILVILKKLFGP